jgi:hypothetical protein
MRQLHTDDRRSRTATARLPDVPAAPRPYLEAKAFTTRAASRIRNNFADHSHRTPEHLERHFDDLLRGPHKLAIAALPRWHHLTQLLESRDTSVRCSLRPQLRVAFRGQGVIGRIDFDRVELLGVKAQPLFSAFARKADKKGLQPSERSEPERAKQSRILGEQILSNTDAFCRAE